MDTPEHPALLSQEPSCAPLTLSGNPPGDFNDLFLRNRSHRTNHGIELRIHIQDGKRTQGKRHRGCAGSVENSSLPQFGTHLHALGCVHAEQGHGGATETLISLALLVGATVRASERQVVRIARTAVLPRANVLDVEREKRCGGLWQATVVTSVRGAPPDQVAKPRLHRGSGDGMYAEEQTRS